MTSAERQKRYRERHKPKTRQEEFLCKVEALVSIYGDSYLTPVEMQEALKVLDDWVLDWRLVFYRREKAATVVEEGPPKRGGPRKRKGKS
jgi:hypothetical protein